MLRQLLAPVVKLMIELGVDFRTFADAARRAYIDVAGAEYGIRGRPTNTSRISLLTGINRRDVARLRGEDKTARPDSADESNSLSRVLSGWYLDPDFIDADGVPRPLARGPELDVLLARYAGDVPGTALIKELQRVGAVAVEDDRVRPLTRYYMPFELDERSIARYGSVLADLALTVNHNLLSKSRDAARFEGRAVNTRISRREYAEFRALVEQEGERFLEHVDAWLTAHERAADDSDGADPAHRGERPQLRLGAGAYLICTPPDPEEPR